MRFLIFNMVVFLSIGYLFTAAPGQSVGNWLDATINMFSQTVASAPEIDGLKQMTATEDKLAQSATLEPTPATVQNDDTKITADKIQKIISDSINSSLKEIVAGAGGVETDKLAPTPRVATTTVAPVNRTAPSPIDHVIQTIDTGTKSDPVKQESTSPSVNRTTSAANEVLAREFAEQYPADPKSAAVISDSLAPLDMAAAPVFMNTGDRQAALSELIQNLQLTYLERAGQ